MNIVYYTQKLAYVRRMNTTFPVGSHHAHDVPIAGRCETFGCEGFIDEVVERGNKFIGVCNGCIKKANQYRVMSRSASSLPVILSAMTKQKSNEKITKSLGVLPQSKHEPSLSDDEVREVSVDTARRHDLAAEIEALTFSVLTPDELGGLSLVVKSLREC